MPIYADTNPKDYIRTVSEFRILLEDNPTILGANRYAGVASTVFRKMLKDSAYVRSMGDQSGYFILGIHLEGMGLIGRFQVL